MTKEIISVCSDCGNKHGKGSGGACTFNKGICNICKKETHITNVRNYNYLRGSEYFERAYFINSNND